MFPKLLPNYDQRDLLGFFSLDGVREFEEKFALEFEKKGAVAFPYGRTSLLYILKVLQIEGKEIICPAYTCVVVAHSIIYSGNIPVFVDSRSDDFNMDLEEVEDFINDRTGAIIATSIFGYPVDLEKLRSLKQKYSHIQIIQDCAHSFACEFKGEPVQNFGIASFYGMNISKIMNSIFGGMVVSDDLEFLADLRRERDATIRQPTLRKYCFRSLYFLAVLFGFRPFFYRIIHFLAKKGLLNSFTKYFDDNIIDMPEDFMQAMTNVEARVGLVQLRKYRSIINTQRNCAKIYDEGLTLKKGVQKPPLIDGATYSHYVLRVKNKEKFVKSFADYGFEVGTIIEYIVPHLNVYKCSLLANSNFNTCQDWPKETINLPVYSELVARKLVARWPEIYSRAMAD